PVSHSLSANVADVRPIYIWSSPALQSSFQNVKLKFRATPFVAAPHISRVVNCVEVESRPCFWDPSIPDEVTVTWETTELKNGVYFFVQGGGTSPTPTPSPSPTVPPSPDQVDLLEVILGEIDAIPADLIRLDENGDSYL